MVGLGDSIYIRAFIRHYPGSHVVTCWPELFEDLDVYCVKAQTQHRTHAKGAHRSDYEWATQLQDAKEIQIVYTRASLRREPITVTLRRKAAGEPVFDLPDYGLPPWSVDRPVAIVRPVTVRIEYPNKARNPKPEYIASASRELKRRGFYVVSIADLEEGKEWLVGDAPDADLVLHNGELNTRQLLAAIQGAAVVVGGPGWIIPACISSGTPLYVALGGSLKYNAPDKLTDPAMDLSKTEWAWPDTPCYCTDFAHSCTKDINGFDAQFTNWLDRQGICQLDEKLSGVAATARGWASGTV